MYATAADLEKRLKREYAAIYADEDTGVADETLVEEDLGAAAAEIDGKVSVRYEIPVTNPGALALLKAWNLDLAAELAFGRTEGAVIPEKVKNRAETVRKNLDAIAKGDMKLSGAAAESASGPGASAIIAVDEPEFTREKMQGF